MCFSSRCLKVTVGISAVLTLVLGIAALVCAILIGKTDIFVGSVKDAKQGVMYTCLVLGVILIIIGLSGVIGSCKKSSCCLAIFNIGTGIFMLLFIALGIASLVLFNKFNADLSDQLTCQKTDWLKDINEFALKANGVLCHSSCPCAADPLKYPDLVTSPTGAKKVQECKDYDKQFDSYSEYLISMEAMERELDCSGICEPKSRFYMFSDVSKGEPIDACGPRLMDYLNKYSKAIGAISITIGALLLIILILSCCLCCRSDKDEGGHYHRMK
jgi:hypothetical protein